MNKPDFSIVAIGFDVLSCFLAICALIFGLEIEKEGIGAWTRNYGAILPALVTIIPWLALGISIIGLLSDISMLIAIH